MTRTYTNRRYLDAIEKKVLVFDGAMGTSLQVQNLTAEHFGGEQYNGCNDYLVISYPEAVEKVHRSFLEVGVDVLETDTFRANRLTMAEYGLQDRVLEMNETAAKLARRLADEYSVRATRPDQAMADGRTEKGRPYTQPRFVAGSIGPTGKLPSASDPELSNVSFDELADIFREQAAGLIRGGVDLLLIETSQDILEVKAAITGCHQAFAETGVWLPIQAQVTLDTTGRMLLGTNIEAALTILEGMGIDVIGLNCSTGPEHMREPIRVLGEQSTLPVSCIPNAGLPLNVDGQAVYPLEPEPFAEALFEFVDKNHISVVGGCCGTTPAHLKALVDKLDGHPHPLRPSSPVIRLSSAMSAISMRQDPPPTLLGERCNAQGSKKFKRLLLEEDYDAILEIAREQVEYGAHALDISCAVTERPDEAELMRKVVKKLEMGVDVPLVIDTTELDVLEIALKTAPGRCLINSTHLEGGRAKADKIFALAKQHNAAVIVLTIDENGMAKPRDRKLEVARRIYDIAVNDHGLRPDALVFDALTFTLATGDPEFAESAIETIEGIRLIKQNLPGVLTSLGVSNLSFGFAPHARPVLNSVMLHHCVQAGLDMAIINPAHVTAYADIPADEKELAEDLLFNRRPDALQRYIEHYENVTPATEATLADPTEGMTPEQRLHWKIVHRHKEGVEADIDEIINRPPSPMTGEEGETLPPESGGAGGGRSRHEVAVHTLNHTLLPAMKEVGDKFGAGELILPFVLQSAEVMKKAVGHLETYLEKVEGITKGTVVIATVYGDVHDIGKNLVKTILANNGYTVIDLGKQTPAETIISKAVEVNATAIGLSALLVSTSKQMPLIVNELQRRGLKIPVLVGGAAINRRFGRRILFTEDGSPYEPGVFYCKDAFEGLETMDRLIDVERKPALLEQVRVEADMEMGRASSPRLQVDTLTRSNVVPAPIKLPEKLGFRVVKDMPLEMVFQHLNINELYRLSWGAKNAHGPEWEKLQKEFGARLDSMKREAIKTSWLKPQAVYGYFPCQADGDELVIYDPASSAASPESLTRFTFPRQPSGDFLCLADYFAPVNSGQFDTVAFQVVTVGHEATERFDKFQADGNYSEGYFTHGLAVQTAEATAEYLHQHIRRELGLAEGRGKRYSWGYPAIPELEDHRKVFDLLPVEKELGMSLSSAYQLIPEQSTAAIIVHHPQAKYYSIGESRVEQLMK
ncbi:MAG: 5-methyltetrahydrofolate--homocysteine methyltransferase [Anaerolineaceae bacterium]|nr:MAG: 5-methyltetrahydrofolate--homocysteine methyltransferase [Anaerolineaceae bacterium]